MSDQFDSTFEDNLTLVDDEGRVVIQVGLLVTLYFENGPDLDKRKAVAACFEEYRSMCGGYLRWAHPSNRGFQSLDRPPERDPSQWLLREGLEDEGWEFYWHGGKQSDSASHFKVQAMGASKGRTYVSYFSACLPLTWFADYPGDFPSLVQNWCRKLQPLHGYGGIAILESPRLSVAQTHERTVYAMARRFPGLEVDYPESHVIYLKDGIKGGSWLTILAEYWILKLGGLFSVRNQLGEGFIPLEYPGGVVIQAGVAPQIGDVNRRISLDLYRRLAQVLQPIRIKEHGRFHSSEDSFDLNATKEWLTRFD